MALVTVQRTPSGVSSPQSSASESGGQEEEDSGKTGIRSLNECYFAGRGTVLMLGSNERLVRPNSCSATHFPSDGSTSHRSFSNMSQASDFTLATTATGTTTTTRSASASSHCTSEMAGCCSTDDNNLCADSQNCGSSTGNDIQKHLQSMFFLLRPEETLKMAVKLESMRAGRTRYLVVVSRPVKRQKPSASHSTSSSSSSTLSHQLTGSQTNTNSQNNKLQQPCTTTTSTTNVSSTTVNNQSDELCVSCTNEQLNKNCDTNNGNIVTETQQQQQNPPISLPLEQTTTSSNLENNISDTNSGQQSCFNCRKNSSLAVEVKTTIGEDEIEESCLLGIDCNEETTVGLVLKVLNDTSIRLDGDGGFSVSVSGRTHIFKPVSVQAMSALQTLHKVSGKAREQNFFAGGASHQWAQYYEEKISSDRSCINEWHTMDSIESRRPPSPDSIRSKPTEREETERIIRSQLKEILMSVDLDEVTSKYIRSRLESQLNMDFSEYKSFIDEEMLVILGQMDAPTEIFDHVYLGSEWNASNLDELQKNGVGHILNVTREIDNFFPGCFEYFNVRVYDDDKTNLLRHWDDTYKYISQAKDKHSKVLVHCKMGISRSASVVIAYAMKAYNWDFETALHHVKVKRSCIKPNRNFMTQLETYQGMLDAMKNKEKLQRSKSDTNLKSTKDARLLPGSEPTPLIQALTGDKGSRGNANQAVITRKTDNNKKKVRKRPRSCSPENRKSTCTRMHKPHSISLEHLADPTRSITCSSVHCNWNKTVLMPCDNGQNYSVSQNQIVHLEQQQREESPSSVNTVPSVKLIVSELELNDRKAKEVKRSGSVRSSASESQSAVKENLDPSEEIIAHKPPSPMWSSSSHVIQSKSPNNDQQIPMKSPSAPSVISVRNPNDLFSAQVDRVFDREERKQATQRIAIPQNNNSNIPPNVLADVSRNNSWSSVDSAVVMGETPRDVPSRHSSWGSGDNNRNTPSRNSSWGSYDMRNANINNVDPGNSRLSQQQSQHNVGNLSPSDESKEEISKLEDVPWTISGTVKRTKQKIEEQVSVVKRICSEAEVKTRPKRNSGGNARCSSEEVLSGTNLASNVYSRLSASAPETVSVLSTSPALRQLKPFSSVDESDELNQQTLSMKKTDNSNNRSTNTRAAGMVKNLKMNFEAKVQQVPLMTQSADNNTTTANDTTKKKGRSLPSSPVHTDPNQNSKSPLRESTNDQKSDDNLEDINVRNLVDRYEETKMRSNISYRNSFPASKTKRNSSIDIPPSQQQPRHITRRPRPMSVLETKSLNINTSSIVANQQQQQNQSSIRTTSKPLMINHATIFLTDDSRRPPIPINTNNVGKTTISVLNKTNNNNNNNNNSGNQVVGCKKFLQHGKTHPLARLDISKQKLNTTTPYNTILSKNMHVIKCACVFKNEEEEKNKGTKN
uniref:protein-serine/threonine phosphatase n=1 Tax=Culicoides sonorensis TaxID=179676 RepID=A0A336LRZ2_CULSO